MEPIFNGKGATGLIPIVKQSLQNLIAETTYIIQTDKPNKLKIGGKDEIEKLSFYTEIARYTDKAKQDPSLLFENTPDVIESARGDPKVVVSTEIANHYETIASHNFLMLLVTTGLLGVLITQYRASLF